jgi:hypothetical protein
MEKQIESSLKDARDNFEKISAILENKEVCNNKKQLLLISYFDVDMEHIQAIHLLISQKLYGSSFALIRPFYETFLRALWMLKLATDEEIDEINNNQFQFPCIKKIVSDIDKEYMNTKFFEEFRKSSWATLCDYTHTGTLQLSRRWTEEELIPNYKNSEIIEVLEITDNILLLFSIVILQEHGYNNEVDELVKK